MPAHKRMCLGLFVTMLLAAGLIFALWRLVAQASPGGLERPEGPDCSLLDDPGIRARMSGAFELSLLLACGRHEWADLAAHPRGPEPADAPQTGPDVRVNDPDPISDYTVQSETSIAVNPDSGVICATYNDIYHSYMGDGTSGFSRSVDGGLTWQDGGPMPPGEGGVSRGDPSVAWRRADGRFYYASLHTDGLGLHRSTDDCATFEWVSMIHEGDSDDKEFMAFDNNPDSPYYGRFYVAWTQLGPGSIQFTYSDDGLTWTEPVELRYGVAFGAWPAVAPNGDLYVAWVRWSNYPYGSNHQEVTRSTDGGATFSLVTTPLSGATVPRDADASEACDRPALNGFIRYFAMPQIVVGPDGCLHIVYSYDPDGYDVGDVVNVYYRRSCDQGNTWGPEIQLNDDGGMTDQFYPALAVSEDNVVAASWYDRRLDPEENYLFDRYWTVSYDGGITWESNRRASDVSSPVYIPPWTTSCYHGDYDQMATLNDEVYLLWSDDRVFFNGHYDPDIWFDRASVAPDFTLSIEPAILDSCRPGLVEATLDIGSINLYDQPVTLSDYGLPSGVTCDFGTNPVFPLPGTSGYEVTVSEGAAEGQFAWLVSGESPTRTHIVTVTLIVNSAKPASPELLLPPDGATQVGYRDIVFQWTAVPAATSYRLQVDDDPGFGSPEADISGIETDTYTLAGPLQPARTYHWRVAGANGCGQGAFSDSFQFRTRFPCILLVDDDDDNPDVRGYYEAALDALGVGYDVFDVGGGAGDGPPLGLMEDYGMVFWFSGDKFSTEGAAGPNATDEAALSSYLDAGGRFFLSSQSYLYDFGITPFGGVYLGIESFVPGAGDATWKVGEAGDPIGSGLVYPLTYPPDMLDHGDIVNPDDTASLAFRGENSHPLDIDKDGDDWKTVFFGTSWVPVAHDTPENGQELLARIVDWFGGCVAPPAIVVSPPAIAAHLEAGQSLTYTLAISNVGDSELTYELHEVSATLRVAQDDLPWLTLVPTSGAVPPGEGDAVAVGFHAETLDAGTYTGSIEVGSNDPVQPWTLVPLTLTVELECDPVSGTAFTWEPGTPAVGQVVTFTAEVTGTLPIALDWSFGDGALGTGNLVTHTYGFSASYTVRLAASNACGSEEVYREITVVEPMEEPRRLYLPLVVHRAP